jgi:para-nitrobenzyl esterase
LQRLWGDQSYGAPSRAFARLAAARGNPVFYYHFTRVGDEAQYQGAYHGSEVPFASGQQQLTAELGHTPYDAALARIMSTYWAAFAATGDPNGPDRPRWLPYTTAADEYLELGAEIRVRRGLRKAEWDALDQLGRTQGGVRP